MVWDAKSLTELATLQPSVVAHPYRLSERSVYCLAFSPDSRRLAAAGRGGNNDREMGTDAKVSFWDTATWEKGPDLACGCDSVYALAYTRSGRLIAGADFAPILWEPGEF